MSKCPFCHFENEAGVFFANSANPILAGSSRTRFARAPDSVNGSAMPPVPEEVGLEAVAEPVHAAAMVEEPIMAGAIPIAEASPIYALAEPPAHETVRNQSLTPPPEQTPLPTGIPSAAADAPSPPSTIDQLVPPGLAGKVPSGVKPKLIVLRGQRQSVEYQIYEGDNYIGRADDKAVDLDLEDQEPPDRIWSSRQHAVISFENGAMTIEDLNSTNGTYLNRTRVESGKKIPLAFNDVIQIGTVQLKVVF